MPKPIFGESRFRKRYSKGSISGVWRTRTGPSRWLHPEWGRPASFIWRKRGAAVTVVGLDEEKATVVASDTAKMDGKAFALCGDIANEKFARHIVTEIVARFGAPNFAWNHVGDPGPAAIEDLDLADFDHAMNLNPRTVPATAAAVAFSNLPECEGSVLFTAVAPHLVDSPLCLVYMMVEFGVVGLSRSLAKRYSRDGIHFNVVCPRNDRYINAAGLRCSSRSGSDAPIQTSKSLSPNMQAQMPWTAPVTRQRPPTQSFSCCPTILPSLPARPCQSTAAARHNRNRKNRILGAVLYMRIGSRPMRVLRSPLIYSKLKEVFSLVARPFQMRERVFPIFNYVATTR